MITAIILTKNNESQISKTLQSLSWCDERIIIDDISDDRTKEICQKLHARVYEREMNNDFSSQRNFGLDKAKGDWVLFVDSDETVSENLQHEIMKKISQKGDHGQGIVGYFIKRDDIFLGKKLRHGETSTVKLLRLAKKHAGTWIRPVHEYWDVKGNTETLVHPLIHAAHTDVAQFIEDINRYTTINAAFLHKEHVRSNLCAIVCYPIGKFIQNYFFRLGFLDGTPGCIMAIMMSMHSFLTRAKLYILQHS